MHAPDDTPAPTVWGPAELVLATALARGFYLDGRSKVELAHDHGISRFRVARLLDRARDTGLVRIEVDPAAAAGAGAGTVDVALSDRLRRALDLRRAVVADVSGSIRAGDEHDTADAGTALRRDAVGTLAAAVLGEIVEEGAVLGVAWGRSLQRTGAALARAGTLRRCTVVQLCGALARPDVDDNSIELTRRAAQAGGGTAVTFHAPLVVATADAAAALRTEPAIAAAAARYDTLTVAAVAIGGWAPGASTVYDALDPAERDRLGTRGTTAEVCGVLLDADGTPIRPGLADRAIGITAARLGEVGEIVALAYGPGKVDAVLAAVRGGLVHTLVTDSTLARALLQRAAPTP